MVQDGSIPALAPGKRGKQFRNPIAKVHRQAKNGAKLNHDGVHLPIAVGQAKVKQSFRDSQVRGGTHRQIFRQTLNDSQDHGQQVVVQASSRKAERKYYRKG
jgi:hypothetical protein